jgi:hypothetical protein
MLFRARLLNSNPQLVLLIDAKILGPWAVLTSCLTLRKPTAVFRGFIIQMRWIEDLIVAHWCGCATAAGCRRRIVRTWL